MKIRNPFAKLLFTRLLPNLVLAVGILLLMRADLLGLSFALVLVSKWQILRGGRKLWLRNIRDNACDLAVGVASVGLMWLMRGQPVTQSVIAGLYYVWLAVLKPLKGHAGVALQAMICQFLGLTAVFLLGRELPALAILGLSWLVALIAADHLISAYHERAHTIISLAWALVVTEAAWLFWHWLVAYSFFHQTVVIPQAALIITLISYVFGSMYLDHMQTKLGKRRLIEYVILLLGLTLIIIIGTQWVSRV